MYGHYLEEKYIKFYTNKHSGFIGTHGHRDQFGSFGYELVYVLSGKGEHLIAERRDKIESGCYLFLDSGIQHGYDVAEGNEIEIINLTFDFRALDLSPGGIHSLSELAGSYGVAQGTPNDRPADDYSFKDTDGEIKELFFKIGRELEEKKPGYLQIAKGLILEILIKGFREYYDRASNRYSEETEYILDRINKNYMLSPSLSEYAAELGRSVTYLSIKFKREVGIGFLDYLHAKRISEGRRLIAMTDESIEMIAERVGYSDTKRFREIFREKCGTTPREYRKTMQKQ